MTRSSIRVRTGVMEIGLKSAGAFGEATFCIGRMDADFHCRGTIDVVAERLKRCVSGL